MRASSDTARDQEPSGARCAGCVEGDQDDEDEGHENHEEIRVTDLTTAPDPTRDLLRRPLGDLMAEARSIRDARFGNRITYSPKVFIPLTMLCRDQCG